MARLKEYYQCSLRPQLLEVLGLSNVLQVPRLLKIVINMGVGSGAHDSRRVVWAVENLAAITGQRPVITKSHKSVAAFKIRAGMKIGVKVTLRKDRMYEFLDRLITIAMPRIRDFRGISPDSFDGHGNYSFGIREHLIFPEVKYDKVDSILGMDVSIVTTAKIDSEGRALLEGFGIPFVKHKGDMSG